VADSPDLRTATTEYPDDAAYAWWRSTHPAGYVLAVSAREPPVLHCTACSEIDRDRHPKRLHAAGRRQICAETPAALRAWVARELPGASPVLARCPKCSP
jgi:hypothetical protein